MADLIVFNRCTDELKQMLYKKNIRAMNPRATIFLDDVNGGSEDYRDNMPRPFDLDAPVIDISDENFGLWYVDATGDPEPYIGKTVKFKGMVYKTCLLYTSRPAASPSSWVCAAGSVLPVSAWACSMCWD